MVGAQDSTIKAEKTTKAARVLRQAGQERAIGLDGGSQSKPQPNLRGSLPPMPELTARQQDGPTVFNPAFDPKKALGQKPQRSLVPSSPAFIERDLPKLNAGQGNGYFPDEYLKEPSGPTNLAEIRDVSAFAGNRFQNQRDAEVAGWMSQGKETSGKLSFSTEPPIPKGSRETASPVSAAPARPSTLSDSSRLRALNAAAAPPRAQVFTEPPKFKSDFPSFIEESPDGSPKLAPKPNSASNALPRVGTAEATGTVAAALAQARAMTAAAQPGRPRPGFQSPVRRGLEPAGKNLSAADQLAAKDAELAALKAKVAQNPPAADPQPSNPVRLPDLGTRKDDPVDAENAKNKKPEPLDDDDDDDDLLSKLYGGALKKVPLG